MSGRPRLLHAALLGGALAGAVVPGPARAQTAPDSFDCLMDPAQVVEVGSPVTGVVDGVLVGRGDAVEEGQVLARLDSTLEQATVELLRTRAQSTRMIDTQNEQLAMLSRRLERMQTLRDRAIATEDALDQVTAEYLSAQSLLNEAELNRDIALKELARAEAALSLREIRSPLDGIVLERAVAGGEYIGQDDHLMEIVQLDPLHVEAFLPVRMFGEVAPGDRATIRPAPPLEGEYEAEVQVVDRVFDAASGTFRVRLVLPNPEGALPGGHRCSLTVAPGS